MLRRQGEGNTIAVEVGVEVEVEIEVVVVLMMEESAIVFGAVSVEERLSQGQSDQPKLLMHQEQE